MGTSAARKLFTTYIQPCAMKCCKQDADADNTKINIKSIPGIDTILTHDYIIFKMSLTKFSIK